MVKDKSGTDVSLSEFLSRDECRAIFDRIVQLTRGGGETQVSIVSRYTGSAAWVRNAVHLTRVVSGVDVRIRRFIRGAGAQVATPRTDVVGLREAVERAESSLRWWPEMPQIEKEPGWEPPPEDPMSAPNLWSEKSYAMTGAERGNIARAMIAPVENAGLLAAGELRIAGQGTATLHTTGEDRYYRETRVACSMTVRDGKGNGSGWAGQTHSDLTRIDPLALGRRALEKCQQSAGAVGLEPGYYTAILEPQAVADLLAVLMKRGNTIMNRRFVEMGPGYGPFAYKVGQSKIGQQVLDRSVTIHSDPMDPDGGFVPFERNSGVPYQPVSWFADGVLRNLWYDRSYALQSLNRYASLLMDGSYRLSANTPEVSVDDMIRSTERGILVTRLHNIRQLDSNTLVCGGYTRDGLWFIRNGKIDRPIKNFRFTESPLFVFNKIEAVGTPVRVFDLDYARVVPPVKVRDFYFTSLADAV